MLFSLYLQRLGSYKAANTFNDQHCNHAQLTRAGLGQLCEPHEVGIEKSCMSYVIVAHRVPESSVGMFWATII